MNPSSHQQAENTSKRNLQAIFREGLWGSVMVGMADSYLSALGILLGATPVQIGALATVPPLVSAFLQRAGVAALELLRTRRLLILSAAVCQSLALFCIALLAAFSEYVKGFQVYLLMGLAIVYLGATGFNLPIWNSLVGDLVPAQMRGRFFAQRTRFMGLASFLALLFGGWMLHLTEDIALQGTGFAAIFAIAGIARLGAAHWTKRYEDPPFESKESDRFSFLQFVKRAPYSNFFKFVLFVAGVNFAVSLAGPYFAVYMLRELSLSYSEYTFIVAAAVLSQFFTLHHWGEISDRFGNKKLLSISAVALTIIPFFWSLGTSPIYLFILQLYSGVVWSGFNLAASNFLFDAVTPAKRARCVAYQTLMTATFTFFGSLLGGYLIDHPQILAVILPSSSSFLNLYSFSGIMRIVVVTLLLRLFREVRPVEEISHRKLVFRMVYLLPFTGSLFTPLDEKRRKKRE